VGVEVKREAIKAVVGRDRWTRVPWLQVVGCELDVGKEAIPQVKGKGDMNRCKGGGDMVFSRTNVPFGKIRTVIIRGQKLNGCIDSRVGKIGTKGRRGFAVRGQICDDVADVFEEKEGDSKRGDM
jgi:hypothetical protein